MNQKPTAQSGLGSKLSHVQKSRNTNSLGHVAHSVSKLEVASMDMLP